MVGFLYGCRPVGCFAACSFLIAACFATTLQAQQNVVIGLEQGYLFIDGSYVEPPYEIEASRDSVSINGTEFSADYFDVSSYVQTQSMRRSRMTGWRRGADSDRWAQEDRWEQDNRWEQDDRREPAYRRGIKRQVGDRSGSRDLRSDSRDLRPGRWLANDIRECNAGGIVILYQHAAPAVIYPSMGGYELLNELTMAGLQKPDLPISDQSMLEVSLRLANDLQPNTAFVTRVTEQLGEVDAATIESDRLTSANLRAAKFNYPITIFAMAVVVLACGHLLSVRPNLQNTAPEIQWKGIVAKSLAIVALLSIVDLVWTLLATDAGMMRELNPIGSKMIRSPVYLAVFKVGVTGAAIGLLFRLHRNTAAQVASWWCCLLLTLLTARWLVFQSMFM